MTALPTDDVRKRLLRLLIGLGDRLDGRTQRWTQEFLDHNELGLALETIADGLSEADAPISDDERQEMLALVADAKNGVARSDGRGPQ
jgi:hypothetical protein